MGLGGGVISGAGGGANKWGQGGESLISGGLWCLQV